MKKIIILFFLSSLCFGCAASTKKINSSKPQYPSAVTTKEKIDDPQQKFELNNKATGVIFAKTDFQGVLRASYVKLFFENLEDASKNYQLIIGDTSKQNILLWEGKTVEPGYFFLELPAGKYKISSIAIPVGSTSAEEAILVTFEVLPKRIVYLGTLKLIGTKERIKWGGVPIIRPGFEYMAQVLDQHEEALSILKQKHPDINKEFKVQLMKM